MGKVKLGVILENAARIAGRQVSTLGVPDNWRALGALAMGDGIRRIAAEKFPMMQRIEYRRFRPTWSSNSGWTQGQECFYNDEYYRLDAASGTGTPGTTGSGWTLLTMDDVTAFIAFEQPWENTVIDSGGVDINRFAYVADPRQNPFADQLKIVGLTDLGILLQKPAPKGVYVRFVPKYPNISFVEWASTNAYAAGDVVYMTSTKDCYIASYAVEAGGSSPASDTTNWSTIRISDVFEPYLTRLVAVDFLTEDQGKYQTRAAADKEFEDLCIRHHEGNGENRIRTGRFIR